MKIIGTVAILLFVGCYSSGSIDKGDNSGDSDDENTSRWGEPCCKRCGTTSQACGDSCIANDLTCHKDYGCACE